MLPKGHSLQAGKYKITKQIGSGGFGLTYLAEDTRLKRKVVIKTPNQQFRADQDYKKFVRRFQREGQALSKINHPNVVQVYEYFQEAGMPCLVMAYVAGETLNERIRNKGRLPQDFAVGCFRKLAEALHMLHKRGLIHCDIHPGNIILRSNGEPVIIDFGSAKLLQPGTFTVTTTVNESFAPYEQGNKKINPQPTLDIYALAATLYFSVTGQKPQSSISRKMFGDKLQPPKQLCKEIKDQLNDSILKGMELEAKNRSSSMLAWINLLYSPQPIIIKPSSKIVFSTSQPIWWSAAIFLSVSGMFSFFLFRKTQTNSTSNGPILTAPTNSDLPTFVTTPISPTSEQSANNTTNIAPISTDDHTSVDAPIPSAPPVAVDFSAQTTEAIASTASNFYVIASYTGDASLNKARELVPDAFVRRFKVGDRIQLAAFDNRAQAEEQVAFLNQQDIYVEVFGPTNE